MVACLVQGASLLFVALFALLILATRVADKWRGRSRFAWLIVKARYSIPLLLAFALCGAWLPLLLGGVKPNADLGAIAMLSSWIELGLYMMTSMDATEEAIERAERGRIRDWGVSFGDVLHLQAIVLWFCLPLQLALLRGISMVFALLLGSLMAVRYSRFGRALRTRFSTPLTVFGTSLLVAGIVPGIPLASVYKSWWMLLFSGCGCCCYSAVMEGVRYVENVLGRSNVSRIRARRMLVAAWLLIVSCAIFLA